MKIEFDQVADALYAHLTEGEIEKTSELAVVSWVPGQNFRLTA